MRAWVGLMRGLMRKDSSMPSRNKRMKRSLIMSNEATFTPRLLSSEAKSCLRTLASVLKPVSVGISPLLTPLLKAAISASERRGCDSAMDHWIRKVVKYTSSMPPKSSYFNNTAFISSRILAATSLRKSGLVSMSSVT